MKEYRTRKEQIDDDFFGAIVKQCKADGVRLSRKARAVIREELRSAAMVGACEERFRTLNLAKSDPSATAAQFRNNIVAMPVLKVLGYE